MITRFISEGLVGVPDMDITLGPEKKVIIQGPNGSGKTSLLRQITHPLSSHNRFNKLRKGVEEGFTEMHLDYYGRKYQVKHIYKRDSKSVKVMSYLFKEINGEYISLTDNGLVNSFKSVVEKELDYSDYLFDICNIGSHNRGIIDYTNQQRLDYLKKVFNLEVLTELKKKVNENYNMLNGSLKYVENDISKLTNLDELERQKKLTEANALSLEQKRTNLQSKLADMRRYSEEDISDLEYKVKDNKKSFERVHGLLHLLESGSKFVDDIPLKDLSYEILEKYIGKKVAVLSTTIEQYKSNIMEINEELITIKDISSEDLKKDLERLESSINNIRTKYKGKSFIDMDMTIIQNISNSLNTILTIINNTSVSLHDIRNVMSEYDNIRDYYNIKEEEILLAKNELTDSREKLESISISETLVNIHAPEDLCKPTCPFRHEYNRQMEQLSVANLLKEKIDLLEKNISSMEDSFKDVVEVCSVIKNLRNIDIPKELSKFTKAKLIDLLNREQLLSLIKQLDENLLYIKSMDEVLVLEDKRDSIKTILEVEAKSSADRKDVLLEKLNNIELKKKDVELNYLKYIQIEEEIKNTDLPIDLRTLVYSDMDENYINNLRTYIEKNEEKLKEMKNSSDLVNKMNEDIIDINKQLKENTDIYYNLENEIKRTHNLTQEFEKLNQDVTKIKAVREVVSSKLPAKSLESRLFDVARNVNFLLDGIMSIRFDTTDGVEIICTINSEERLANFLSNGEKSLLSLALLVVIKKIINWDVISIDEGSAALDENNKDRYLQMISSYTEGIDTIKQIFIVSHDYLVIDGEDLKIIKL